MGCLQICLVKAKNPRMRLGVRCFPPPHALGGKKCMYMKKRILLKTFVPMLSLSVSIQTWEIKFSLCFSVFEEVGGEVGEFIYGFYKRVKIEL